MNATATEHEPLLDPRFSSTVNRVRRAALVALIASVPSWAMALTGGLPAAEYWLVRVSGAHGACIGSLINEQMVVTASHCQARSVIFADRNIALRSVHDIPGTDIAVLMMETARPVEQYPRLWAGPTAEPKLFPLGTVGTAFGAELAHLGVQMRLRFDLKHYGIDTNGTEVFYMNNGDGTLDPGDSGGPLLIDGLLVGVTHAVGAEGDGGAPEWIFHAISPALPTIAELDRQRKAHAFIAIDE